MALTPPTIPPTTESTSTQQVDTKTNSWSPDGRNAKRQKVTRACDICKSRKRRCNGQLPCSSCQANGTKCAYQASYTRGRLVQPVPAQPWISTEDLRSIQASPTQPSEPRTKAPSNGTESQTVVSRAGSPEASSTFAGQYLGPTSPYTFLRRVWQRFEQDGVNTSFAGNATEDTIHQEPIYAYGDRRAPRVDIDNFELPSPMVTSTLLTQYFDLSMPTYRFLHKPTVAGWLSTYHQQESRAHSPSALLPSRQAIVLLVLATARLLNVGDNKEFSDPDEQAYHESEILFKVAQGKLEVERGKPRLESVQARLATCLYLLHTSRPNQAWYQFGTTIQIIMALGLHRANGSALNQQDPINSECRKRAFWAASTLDTYLSVMFGRPPLLHLDDVDQKLDLVDDEDISTAEAAQTGPVRDSVIRGSVLHAQITRIVKKAARQQYSVGRKSSSQKLETASKLNQETAEWHASLPVVLSGAIHPSSLIPVFRRQITVLQLAHCHAQMLINRPSLLLDTVHTELKHSHVETCLLAAKTTLETVLAASLGKHIFSAFWYTQFVSFNALSIIYVWLIQRRHGRLPGCKTVQEDELLRLVQTAQQHLVEASHSNAPSLRYSIVLKELHEEVQRLDAKAAQRPAQGRASSQMPLDTSANASDPPAVDGMLVNDAPDPPLETFTDDFPLDPDLWLSLDAFPFSDFTQME